MNSEIITVEQVRVELTRRLRQAVLRPQSPPELSVYESDDLPSAQHFAAWRANRIIGVVSIHQEDLPDFSAQNSWRLRGMAVAPESQNQGVGKLLLTEAINFIGTLDGDVLWCNARVTAQRFYQSFGFEIVGDEFYIPASGAHFVMMLKILKVNR